MEIAVDKIKKACVITLKGDLPSDSMEKFEKTLLDQVQAGEREMILNLSLVDRMESEALRILFRALMDMKRTGGKFRIVVGKTPLSSVLVDSGVSSFVELFPNVDEALSA